MKIISVAIQKGGSGKSSTSSNVSVGLAMKGFKTMLVDLDPQGNATQSIGEDKNKFKQTIYDCLTKNIPIDEVVIKTEIDNLYVCPANIRLADAEAELLSKIGREMILKRIFSEMKQKFDYIIIDCPPSLGVLSINALTASNSVIIPIESSEFSLSGMDQFLTSLDLIKYLNKELEIEGVLITRAEPNTNTFKKCYEQLKNLFGDKCYDFYIPRNQAISDAQSSINFTDGKPKPAIYSNPSAKGSQMYTKLVDEVIKNDIRK